MYSENDSSSSDRYAVISSREAAMPIAPIVERMMSAKYSPGCVKRSSTSFAETRQITAAMAMKSTRKYVVKSSTTMMPAKSLSTSQYPSDTPATASSPAAAMYASHAFFICGTYRSSTTSSTTSPPSRNSGRNSV